MTRNDLRTLFATPKGEQVLLWILHRLNVFSNKLKTSEEIALHNFGMELLSLIGPNDTKKSVSAFMKIAMSGDEN